MKSLAELIIQVKRTARYGAIDQTADAITADIVRAINDVRGTMWRRFPWSFGLLSFTATLTAGTSDYTAPATIGRLLAIGDEEGTGTIKFKPLKYYLKERGQYTSNGTPRYGLMLGRDSSGAIKYRVYPTPSAALSYPAFGIAKYTVYSTEDIASDTAMDFFLDEHDGVILNGVLAQIYEGQKEPAKAASKQNEFLRALEQMVADENQSLESDLVTPLSDWQIRRIRGRKRGLVC